MKVARWPQQDVDAARCNGIGCGAILRFSVCRLHRWSREWRTGGHACGAEAFALLELHRMSSSGVLSDAECWASV